MALFSFFGKKKSLTSNPVEEKDNTPVAPQQEANLAPVDDAIEREADGLLRTQREIARITAEKIDAIESEIARDILKSPASPHAELAADAGDAIKPAHTAEHSPNSMFHTTLVRLDKETMILFKEDMDE